MPLINVSGRPERWPSRIGRFWITCRFERFRCWNAIGRWKPAEGLENAVCRPIECQDIYPGYSAILFHILWYWKNDRRALLPPDRRHWVAISEPNGSKLERLICLDCDRCDESLSGSAQETTSCNQEIWIRVLAFLKLVLRNAGIDCKLPYAGRSR